MQNEHGIAEDFEQYDDEREFRRLVRAVRFSKKHYLYFACCNQVPKQNELIADVKKSLNGKKIKVVKFKKPLTDLLGELQKRKIAADCEAVFIQGLEYSISSDGKGSENALIYNLNISRDAFKKYFTCPIFLWLPEYALIKITRHAPDFFSVRSGTFYFSSTAEQVTEQIFQNFTSNWLEATSLPITEKTKKIVTLESLLSEYQGLHKEKRNRETELRLISELAMLFYSISEYRKAIEYDEQAVAISREIDDRSSEGNSLGNLGNDYYSLGDYKKAIEYHKQMLAISLETKDRQDEGNSLGNLGNAYYGLRKYRKAIEYHEQMLKISREIGDRLGEGNSLGNLGIVYGSLGEYTKAVEYQEQAVAISREIGDRSGEGASLGNLGNAYDNVGEHQKAIQHYEQQLAISREIGDRLGEGNSLGNLGSSYYNLGEKKKACDFWRTATAILRDIESPNAKMFSRLIMKNCK